MLRKFVNLLLGRKPPTSSGTLVTGEERDRVLASMGVRTGRGPVRTNKYDPVAGGGPLAAARRVRAMVRNGTASAATIEEYERHVRNGNVYK